MKTAISVEVNDRSGPWGLGNSHTIDHEGQTPSMVIARARIAGLKMTKFVSECLQNDKNIILYWPLLSLLIFQTSFAYGLRKVADYSIFQCAATRIAGSKRNPSADEECRLRTPILRYQTWARRIDLIMRIFVPLFLVVFACVYAVTYELF